MDEDDFEPIRVRDWFGSEYGEHRNDDNEYDRIADLLLSGFLKLPGIKGN